MFEFVSPADLASARFLIGQVRGSVFVQNCQRFFSETLRYLDLYAAQSLGVKPLHIDGVLIDDEGRDSFRFEPCTRDVRFVREIVPADGYGHKPEI